MEKSKEKLIGTSILIFERQKDFLREQRKNFKLSSFVRDKLDEYVNMIKEVEDDKKRIIG